MPHVLLYDIDADRMECTDFDPGSHVASTERTADGDDVWYSGEDSFIIFGTLQAPKACGPAMPILFRVGRLCYLSASQQTATLNRPGTNDIVRVQVRMMSSDVTMQPMQTSLLNERDRLREELSSAQALADEERSRSKKTIKGIEKDARATKKKLDDMTASYESTKTEHAQLKTQYKSTETQAEAYRKQLEQISCARQTAQNGLRSCEPVYLELMTRLRADLQEAAQPVSTAPSNKRRKKTGSSSTAKWAIYRIEFQDDSGNWCTVSDARCVAAFVALHVYCTAGGVHTAVDLNGCGTTVSDVDAHLSSMTMPPPATPMVASCELNFSMGNYAYFARFNPSANPASASNGIYTQYNTSTSKERQIRVVDATTSAASIDDASVKKAKFQALVGNEFPTSFKESEMDVLLKTTDFEQFPYSANSNDEFRAELKGLGDIFADYGQYTPSGGRRIVIDESKCVPLIKPFQLRTVLTYLRNWSRDDGGPVYARLCAHASSSSGLQKIETDHVGLDVSYCRTGCRQGQGNYCAFSYHAGESSSYNQTGVPGKTVLCMFISRTKTLGDPNSGAPYTSYPFAVSYVDSSLKVHGNQTPYDAVAVHGNGFLLPLGIISS